MKKLVLFLSLALAVALCGTAPAEAQIPTYDGKLVSDRTGTIDSATLERLNARALAFHRESSVEFVALVVPTLNGLVIEDYSLKVLHEWGVGDKNKDNGVVYVWCPPERRQRIEVGYGLEAYIPDITAANIIETVKNRIPREPAGPRLEAMVEAIIAQLQASERKDPAAALQSSPVPTPTPFYRNPWFWFWVILILLIIVIASIVLAGRDGYGGGGGGGGFFWGSSDGGGWSSSNGSSNSGGFDFGGGDGGGGGASGGD